MDNYLDEVFDAFLDLLRSLPKGTVKVIRPERYELMLKTAVKLKELLRETYPHCQIVVKVDQTFHLGSVSVELDSLTIYNPEAFAELVRQADNFDIYPLTNGNIRLDIAFQSVLKTVA